MNDDIVVFVDLGGCGPLSLATHRRFKKTLFVREYCFWAWQLGRNGNTSRECFDSLYDFCMVFITLASHQQNPEILARLSLLILY